jgi:hypothetical protein
LLVAEIHCTTNTENIASQNKRRKKMSMTAKTKPTEEYRNIPIAQLKESSSNPRKTFDEERLEELAESIRSKRVLSPLLARKVNGHFEIVSGARRYRAALRAIRLYPAVSLVFPFVKLLVPRHTAHPIVCRPPRSHPEDAMPPHDPRPQSTGRQGSASGVRVDCAPRFRKTQFDSFHFSPPFRPLHWARLRGNSCARHLRVFCFSVSSQEISGNGA